MTVLKKMSDAIERSLPGRAVRCILKFREKHFLLGMLFLPLDWIITSVILVVPAIIILILAGIVGGPIGWICGNQEASLPFGLLLVGIAIHYLKRFLNKKI